MLASVFEVTWAVAMKYSEGFSVPQIICVVMIAAGIIGLKLLAKE